MPFPGSPQLPPGAGSPIQTVAGPVPTIASPITGGINYTAASAGYTVNNDLNLIRNPRQGGLTGGNTINFLGTGGSSSSQTVGYPS